MIWAKARINGKKSRAVEQIKDNGEIVSWISISEAARNGYSSNCIIMCCQGKRERHRNSKWRYANQF